MVVEDEEGLLRLFSSLIRRLDYDVLQADGGAEAIDLLKQYTPDLLILDLAMPEVCGTDVLAFVDSQPDLDTMQVMILTALGPMPDMRGLEERIDSWVKKPILPADLQATVRALIEGK
jgi:DNA-binding response OmpR family regulator